MQNAVFFLEVKILTKWFENSVENPTIKGQQEHEKRFSSSKIRLVYLGRNKEKTFFLVKLVNRGLEGIVFVDKKIFTLSCNFSNFCCMCRYIFFFHVLLLFSWQTYFKR